MKPDPEELPQELREITSDVTSIPGTLYFTPEVFDQLNELCVLKRITPTRLIVEAINSQGARWEEFIEEVTIPSKPGKTEIWPEDPLYILARVLMVHLIRVFHKRLEDPSGFEELRKNAPAEWVFLRLNLELVQKSYSQSALRVPNTGSLLG
jgi:hypothetical protein